MSRVFYMPATPENVMPEFEFKQVDMYDRAQAREVLGGDMEVVRFQPPLAIDGLRIVLVVDDEGMIKQKPYNYAGSALYGTHRHGAWIYGDVFLVGEAVGRGSATFVDFPDMTVEAARKMLAEHIILGPDD